MALRYGREGEPVDVLGHDPVPPPPPERDPDAERFFEAIRLRASGVINSVSFATWWRPARGWCWEADGSVLVVALPTPQFFLWWQANYMGWLATFARELGREGLGFRLIVVDPDPLPKLHSGSVR